jgi:hypothetical protein
MNKTIRRDWLKRQIQKGNMQIKTKMILTDDYAYDNATNCQASEWHDAKIEDFYDQDFKYSTGFAQWNDDGTINFAMMCNHYYILRLKNKEVIHA